MILNIHEDKRSNRFNILPVMFVLVGMMFLVPAITEKAQASIEARAISHVGSFSNVRGHLSAGKFLLPPIKEGKDIIWITIGNGLFGGGDERGYVRANVGRLLVTFEFYNPARGANTCAALPPLYTTCTMTQGVHARAMYQVVRSPPPPLLSDVTVGVANPQNLGLHQVTF